MAAELLTFERVVVLSSALVYWAGVCIQARRVRKQIGRSPNVRPRGFKEKVLWAGWSVVVLSWIGLPFLTGDATHPKWWTVVPALVNPLGAAVGTAMVALGYAGTLWCYATMGSAWRMGIDRKNPSELVSAGPYHFVRHPIYLFQIVMVAAVVVLLPSVLALIALLIHAVCVMTKAADEEKHLRALLGPQYETYCASTGRWFPRFFSNKTPATVAPTTASNRLAAPEQPVN